MDEALDVLMDSVTDEMEIAADEGVPVGDVAGVVILAVAHLLAEVMPVEEVQALFRFWADEVPLITVDTGVMH